MKCLRYWEGVNPPVFKRDGRKCDSPRVHDVKLLGSETLRGRGFVSGGGPIRDDSAFSLYISIASRRYAPRLTLNVR